MSRALNSGGSTLPMMSMINGRGTGYADPHPRNNWEVTVDDQRDDIGRFKVGHQSQGGRPIGTPNRITATTRQAIDDAAEALGGKAAVFIEVARKDVVAYGHMMVKLAPKEMKADVVIHQHAAPRFVIACPPRGTYYSPEICRKVENNTATMDEMMGGHPHKELTSEEYKAHISQPAPPAPEHNIVPRTPEEAELLAELEKLTDEELERRANALDQN